MKTSEDRTEMIKNYLRNKCKFTCLEVTPGLVKKLMLRDGFDVGLNEIKPVMRGVYY